VIKVMYFDEPQSFDGVDAMVPRDDRPLRIAFGANALSLLVLGIYWNPLMAWCQQAFGV
jgi:NADH-quinone oxidoreductase subunit N